MRNQLYTILYAGHYFLSVRTKQLVLTGRTLMKCFLMNVKFSVRTHHFISTAKLVMETPFSPVYSRKLFDSVEIWYE